MAEQQSKTKLQLGGSIVDEHSFRNRAFNDLKGNYVDGQALLSLHRLSNPNEIEALGLLLDYKDDPDKPERNRLVFRIDRRTLLEFRKAIQEILE